ncbi:hypothetical protein [Streptomyces mirabilis]|uniref:hypothetical protein n=1 Tax=Streptomyces mirabilis TaxID=68239 RepID=UPI0036BEDBD2
MKKRKTFGSLALAASLTLGGAAISGSAVAEPSASSSPSTASTWHTKTVTATWCLGDGHAKLGGYHGASCFLAEEQVTARFVYNGTSVWQHFVDCSDNHTFPYNVKETWCGYWNNGGSSYGYMNGGANFKIQNHFGSYSHYMRINCDKNGRVWVSGG